MRRRSRITLEGLVPFLVTGLLFGLLYNTLFFPHTLVEYVEAGVIGILLGAAAGLVEQQSAFNRWLQSRSFAVALAARTLSYAIAVVLALSLVLSVEPATLGECAYPACLLRIVEAPTFVRDLVFSTGFVFVAVFVAQIVLLVGTRNFGRLLLGRYRRPRELNAEFMFVDIRGSTGIAEALGPERYSAFLRDFFADVSGPIHRAGGEVHQYVGDEVVVVWSGRRATGDWLDCFLDMREAVETRRAHYLGEYGFLPEFKAGVHAGTVVVTEVGTLQRAHVYHGDVLNTAARIQAQCNETGFDLLASREALSTTGPDRQAGFRQLPPLALRGKSDAVDVLAFTGLGEKPSDRPPPPTTERASP